MDRDAYRAIGLGAPTTQAFSFEGAVMQKHAVWREPRSRKWVAMMRNYVIGAFLVVALLSAIAFALYSFDHDAYSGVAIAAVILATAAICLGPFMRTHLEDVSVMPR